MSHPSANGTSWAEPGEWFCARCSSLSGRVILLPNTPSTYYCEKCLMDAVIGGEISLVDATNPRSCDECGDQYEGSYVCYPCYENAAENSSDDGCGNCGSGWGDQMCTDCHECESFCSSCGENSGDLYCTDCSGCKECGDTDDLRCRSCRRPVAVAAQPVVTTDDGRTFRSDDGIVIQWDQD